MRACSFFLAFALSSTAFAQTYPSKPVHIVVPFAAGGAVDSVARLVAQKLGEGWKQGVVVDNRPGAGSIVGADQVAKATPDGHTLLFASVSHSVTPSMYRKLPFDPIRDLVAVSQVTGSVLVLVASAKQPATTLQALVALGKQKPGGLNYGSTGVGTAGHLAVEMVNLVTGAGMVHVPYKGDAPLINALIAGEVQVGMAASGAVIANVQGGRLRALAVTGFKRIAVMPDVPTLPEAGVPGLDLSSWIGAFAPAGTPAEAINRFQQELARALATQDVRARFAEWGFEPVASTPAEFAARFQQDVATYARVIREAKIPLQD